GERHRADDGLHVAGRHRDDEPPHAPARNLIEVPRHGFDVPPVDILDARRDRREGLADEGDEVLPEPCGEQVAAVREAERRGHCRASEVSSSVWISSRRRRWRSARISMSPSLMRTPTAWLCSLI